MRRTAGSRRLAPSRSVNAATASATSANVAVPASVSTTASSSARTRSTSATASGGTESGPGRPPSRAARRAPDNGAHLIRHREEPLVPGVLLALGGPVEPEVVERVLVGAVLPLRLRGEVGAHPVGQLRRELAAE